jgi:superfamily II DNA or RNA helicase
MSRDIPHYIGPKGYSIKKSNISVEEQHEIKKDLTVKPFAPPNSIQKPKSFSIYRESPKKLYVPRFYGFKKYGIPSKYTISDGEDIDVPFNGSLRDYQNTIISAYLKVANDKGCGLLEIPCGRGKCLGYNTPVKMFNDTIKMVQDIKENDIVMGDDFKPRLVSGVTSGTSKMYTVEQSEGMTYEINDAHILSLFNSNINCVQDISIGDYLKLKKENKHVNLYGIRVFKDSCFIKLSVLNITESSNKKYYGFCVDKNHRFLLGDNTVTHNTVMALNIISQLKKKTIVIVHKEFLMNQWIERIKQFLPSARVGKIQGPIADVKDKDIVIGMLQSLSMKEYEQSIFDQFGLTVVDECHHISAEVFCRSLFKLVTPYMLGLSATMNRKDGLTKVFKMFLGDVAYKEERNTDDKVTVRCIQYEHNDEDFSKTVYNFKGQTHYAIMIRKLCEFNHRSEFILRVLQDTLHETPEQQIMILAHNKSLLHYLYDAIEHRKIASVGYYIGGMKEKALKETETKQVVIATYAMAEEALDIKSLATLIMATPKTDVTQAVGRILRVKHKKPLVIDIVDQHDIFQRQWVKRRRFYMKQKYKITEASYSTYNTEYDKWEIMFEPGSGAKRYKRKIKSKENPFSQGKCLITIDTSNLL